MVLLFEMLTVWLGYDNPISGCLRVEMGEL